MLLSVVAAALVGAMPCHLSLLAPATAPARLQASAPVGLPQEGCGELPTRSGSSAEQPAVGLLGGVLGSAAGTVTGAMLGFAMAPRCEDCALGPEALWVGGLLGLHLGAAFGAYVAGNAAGGRGTWTGTVLGMLGGGLVGLLMSVGIASLENTASTLYVLPLLMPTVGAVAGYALSEPDGPAPCATAAPSPRAPMLRLRFSF